MSNTHSDVNSMLKNLNGNLEDQKSFAKMLVGQVTETRIQGGWDVIQFEEMNEILQFERMQENVMRNLGLN